MNKEGYKDPTAEIAISHVNREQNGVFYSNNKRRKSEDGRKRRTKTEKGQTLGQHQTRQE